MPEVNHTRPLTRLELEAFLQEHAAENEYVHLLSFVDDRTTFWSRHLALKTRKPQTMDTPQYVVEKGPNIITVTLERSDLEPGERAPKMQMIFSDVDGKLAITPRIEGTMVTHRMLDTFDQILKEVSAGQTIIFGDLNQIVTFVGQVADQESTVIGFRQELGNPEQALIEAAVPNPVVYFRMTPKDGKEVEIEALGKGDEGEDDTLLKLIILENKGEPGQFVLAMSAKTREASFERGRELAEQMPEAWNEVRSTKPTPDAAVGIGVSADPIPETPGVNPHALKTPEVIYNPEDNAAQESVRMNVIREHSVGGQDHYLLSHWIGRMLKEGQLSERDRRALTAFHNHIFADGLVNLDQWSYIAEVTSDHTQENKQWLKGDNNAYVAIYDESPNAQNKKQGAVALIQFHVGALVA